MDISTASRKCIALLAAAVLWGSVSAQPQQLPADSGAAGLWKALLEVQTTARVLHVVAHPDDEDGATLAFLARGRGVRTATLSLTRGEGGANLIAPYFFDQLGVLRTLEYLEADRHYGTEQFFTRAADYGYSKNLDEALRKWNGGDVLLGDLVRVVRTFRPDVILSRFWGGPRDGHGHHTLAGILAQKAFDAAADPEQFPDQIAGGLEPWQVAKLYRGNINPRWRPADAEAWTIAIDAGEFDPLLGESYYQIARRGYGFHRSQGILHHDGAPGSRVRYYQLLRTSYSDSVPERETTLFDGFDTSVSAIGAGLGASSDFTVHVSNLARQCAAATVRFDSRHPDVVVPSLVSALRAARAALKQLPADARGVAGHARFQLLEKERQLEHAIAAALGVDIEVAAGRDALTGSSPFSRSSTFRHLVAGDIVDVGVRLTIRSGHPASCAGVELSAPDGWTIEPRTNEPLALSANEPVSSSFRVTVPEGAKPTRPHWHRASIQDPFYRVDRAELAPLSLPAAPLVAAAHLTVLGEPVVIREPARFVLRDPGLGTRYPTVSVAPAVGVRFVVRSGVLPQKRGVYRVEVVVHSDVKGEAAGVLKLELPRGWSSEPAQAAFAFAKEGEQSAVLFDVRPPPAIEAGDYEIRAVAKYGEREYREGYVTIEAPDVGRADYYLPARHNVRVAPVDIAEDLHVGYVMGSGDEVPRVLPQLGVDPVMLEESDLASGALEEFDAIVLGVRAYAVRPDVRKYNGRLLAYVKGGGVLVVQYQTPEFDNNFGPYPYTMGRAEEVSEEDAAVQILAPEHPVFTRPNRIEARDFDGWIEQRGSKFWATWDERYVPLLECHDTGQAPQRGGMLVAKYGRGHYIYSAYSWYRQLPAGVPGAFRLYANLISLGRTSDP